MMMIMMKKTMYNMIDENDDERATNGGQRQLRYRGGQLYEASGSYATEAGYCMRPAAATLPWRATVRGQRQLRHRDGLRYKTSSSYAAVARYC